jgi:hypothetical protein
MIQKISIWSLLFDLKWDPVSKESDCDSSVVPDTLFDFPGFFFTIEHRFPGIEMSHSVKVTPCNIGISLQTDYIEDIIPVCDLPGIDVSSILLSIVP